MMRMDPILLISVSPTSGAPIYRQLIDQIRALVASKRLAAGQLLPSVRQLARSLEINPMTVSKAYSLLERDGLVELLRGQGMRVKNPAPTLTPIKQRREAMIPLLHQVAATGYQLHLTKQQILDLLTPLLEELDHE